MDNLSVLKRQQTKINLPKGLVFGDIKLEIGCGIKKVWNKKCNLRIDVLDYGQEIVWDVEKGIPLPDDSCSYIASSQTFEHLKDLIGVMNECWRVLKPEGILAIDVPHKDSIKARLPNHVRLFDKYTFDFFQYASYANEYQSRVWEIIKLKVDHKGGGTVNICVKMIPKK